MSAHPLHGRRHRGARIPGRVWTPERVRDLEVHHGPRDGARGWTAEIDLIGRTVIVMSPHDYKRTRKRLDRLWRARRPWTTKGEGVEGARWRLAIYHRWLADELNARAVPVPEGLP